MHKRGEVVGYTVVIDMGSEHFFELGRVLLVDIRPEDIDKRVTVGSLLLVN